MRPTDADYRRYIHLVDLYRSLDWNPEKMLAATPFRVADIGTNAILLAAEEALLELAPRFGESASSKDIHARIARLSPGVGSLWSAERRWFVSRDLLALEPIPVRTSAGLLPLLTSVPHPKQVAHLADVVVGHLDNSAIGIASTLPGEPGFEAKRYWRGPVWVLSTG